MIQVRMLTLLLLIDHMGYRFWSLFTYDRTSRLKRVLDNIMSKEACIIWMQELLQPDLLLVLLILLYCGTNVLHDGQKLNGLKETRHNDFDSKQLDGREELHHNFRNKHDSQKLNGHEEPKIPSSNGQEVDEREELLHQIRNKTFNLRRTSTAKTSLVPQPATNINVAAILEKANAIRQAFVGSGGGDDDNWSDD